MPSSVSVVEGNVGVECRAPTVLDCVRRRCCKCLDKVACSVRGRDQTRQHAPSTRGNHAGTEGRSTVAVCARRNGALAFRALRAHRCGSSARARDRGGQPPAHLRGARSTLRCPRCGDRKSQQRWRRDRRSAAAGSRGDDRCDARRVEGGQGLRSSPRRAAPGQAGGRSPPFGSASRRHRSLEPRIAAAECGSRRAHARHRRGLPRHARSRGRRRRGRRGSEDRSRRCTCVHTLYVGFDRRTQGCGEKPSQHASSRTLLDRLARDSAARPRERDSFAATAGGLRDVMAALLEGATVLPFDLKREGFGGLVRWIDRERISVLCTVASTLR
jgi:hypothetical protein